jgi:hypothetical protein
MLRSTQVSQSSCHQQNQFQRILSVSVFLSEEQDRCRHDCLSIPFLQQLMDDRIPFALVALQATDGYFLPYGQGHFFMNLNEQPFYSLGKFRRPLSLVRCSHPFCFPSGWMQKKNCISLNRLSDGSKTLPCRFWESGAKGYTRWANDRHRGATDFVAIVFGLGRGSRNAI